MTDEHINGVSKSSYMAVAKDAEARAEMDWGMRYHQNEMRHQQNEKIDKLLDMFGQQPGLCGKKFVKRSEAKIAIGVVIGLLVGWKIIPWKYIVTLF